MLRPAPFVIATVLAGAVPASAATVYVAPGGSGNGSSSSPFGRIQDAISAAGPGDVVVVRAGTYNESLDTVRSGSSSSRITIRAEGPRGSAVVTTAGTVLDIGHAYITIEGLVFDAQYAGSDAMKIGSGGSHFVFRDSEVRRTSRDCVDMAGPTNILVENSLIHHCLNAAGGRTDAHGIVGAAVQGLTVRGTEIHTFSGDAIQLDPSRSAPGWRDLTIEDSHLWLAPLPSATNGFAAGAVTGENALDTKTYTSAPRARVIIRNTIASGFGGGFVENMAAFNLKENTDALVDRVTVFDSEIAFRLRGPALVQVQNAVVYNVARGVRYEDNITNLRFWNNTYGRNVADPFQPASASASGLDVRNLLALGSALPSEAQGAGNLAVAALAFVNAASDDYHLVLGSPAVDRGATISAVTTDRDGVARPQGGSFDVGAYERCASGTCGIVTPPSPPTNVRIIR